MKTNCAVVAAQAAVVVDVEKCRWLGRLCGFEAYSANEFEREIYITACPGNYGGPAVIIVSINGSPPRGIIMIEPHYRLMRCFYNGKAKKFDGNMPHKNATYNEVFSWVESQLMEAF